MDIRNQKWVETEKHLMLQLHQPFWGAWKKYNWPERIEGIGVSVEAIEKALELKKKILVHIMKYGTYEITPEKALKVASNYKFIARDQKPILVIPRNEFYKVVQVNK